MEIINQKAEADKQQLWKILAISIAIDLLTSLGILATYGWGVVVEEVLENIISRQIAKYGKLELSNTDHLLGALPVPGITAASVHCMRKLFSLYA